MSDGEWKEFEMKVVNGTICLRLVRELEIKVVI